jgi:hypothetical protein
VGRADRCPTCDRDVRVCRGCAHYAPGAHNDCREPNAERIVDKERANFCDFFVLAARRPGAGDPRGESRAENARAGLDALFKKA